MFESMYYWLQDMNAVKHKDVRATTNIYDKKLETLLPGGLGFLFRTFSYLGTFCCVSYFNFFLVFDQITIFICKLYHAKEIK